MKRLRLALAAGLTVIAVASCSPSLSPTPTPLPTPPPALAVIEGFIPADSAPAGAVVSISGRHFGSSDHAGRVEFGERPCQVMNWSDTSIQVRLPLELPPGQHQVTVVSGGRRSGTRPFTVLAPTLASVGLRSAAPDFGYAPAVADVDGDGDLDMFAPVNFAESGMDSAYYLNNGDGTFAQIELSAAGLPIQANTYSAVLRDFDGDGDQDLYAAGSSEAFYALNNGDGTFAVQNLAEVGLQMRTDQVECFDVAAADYNRDGYPDLFVGCGILLEGGRDDFYALNNGDGTFTAQDLAARGIPLGGDVKRLAAADWNGDGAPDLWIGHLEAEASYLLNNGDGTFVLQELAAVGLGEMRIGSLPIAADFDSDGDLDLFVQEAEPSTDFVATRLYALNRGDGTFVLQELAAAGLDPLPALFAWLDSADLNGDGHPDLIGSAIFETGGLYALNDGDGAFTLQDGKVAGLPADPPTHEPGIADWDRDGDLDVYLFSAYALNRGDGTFLLLR